MKKKNFLHGFFYKKNEPQKPKNLKKILEKSRASDVWAAIFKNPDFS